MESVGLLTIIFVPLLCLSSESPSEFASYLAKDLGYHFYSRARSRILETLQRVFCSYQGSDSRAFTKGSGFTVAWMALSAAASCPVHVQEGHTW